MKKVLSLKKNLTIKERQKWSALANKITLSRIFVGPVILGTLLLFAFFGLIPALPVAITSVVLLLSDAVDGMIARKHNATTLLGAKLDQVCDKIFGFFSLGAVLLASSNLLLLGIIGLEGIIAYIGVKNLEKGNNLSSSILGKVKTFLLGLTTFVSILGMDLDFFKNNIQTLEMSVVQFISILTMLSQGVTAINYLNTSIKKELNETPAEETKIKVIETKEKINTIWNNHPEIQKIKEGDKITLLNSTKFAFINHRTTIGDIEYNDWAKENKIDFQDMKEVIPSVILYEEEVMSLRKKIS